MLVSTIVLTVCAVLLGGTIGVFVAIFMAYYCPKKLKGIYTQIINLLVEYKRSEIGNIAVVNYELVELDGISKE